MKIKRKEYDRLLERSQILSDLEHTTIVVRVRSFVNDNKPEPIGPNNQAKIITAEILRENLINYVKANVRGEWERITPAKPWIVGRVQIDFIRQYSGYEYALQQHYGSWFQFREATEPLSLDTLGTVPDSETKATIGAVSTQTSQEGGTITESGKTAGALPPSVLHADHVVPVRECEKCYYLDGRLKGFTYRA